MHIQARKEGGLLCRETLKVAKLLRVCEHNTMHGREIQHLHTATQATEDQCRNVRRGELDTVDPPWWSEVISLGAASDMVLRASDKVNVGRRIRTAADETTVFLQRACADHGTHATAPGSKEYQRRECPSVVEGDRDRVG